MRKSLALIIMILLGTCYISDAQRRQTVVTYYDNGYYDNDRNNRLVRYQRDNFLFDQMSRNDRRRLVKLERKLYDRADRAWEDGFISDRDRRRVREVERDIYKLLRRYDYVRRNNRANRNGDRNRRDRDRRNRRGSNRRYCWQ